MKRIETALISVYHKEGLREIAEQLHKLGVKIFATGGSFDFIKSLGIPVTAVEDLTGYPAILGGRVKTLHPGVFAGILAVREDKEHASEMSKHNLGFIDLVMVDLYPFDATVKSGASEEEIIEKIDIGGISLIRAAAKNFRDVLIIPSVDDYGFLLNILLDQLGQVSSQQRKDQAVRAFKVSSQYDSIIHDWFHPESIKENKDESGQVQVLRYGENPHQNAEFVGALEEVFERLHGKELSYNNLLDLDAAVGLIREFDSPTVAIIKHNNACGLATDSDIVNAWKKALAGDPVSAFGGVIISNRTVEAALATEMNKLFFELLIAPGYSDEALELLKTKKNRILLSLRSYPEPGRVVRSVLNGILRQDPDLVTETEGQMNLVTKVMPSVPEYADLVFANKIVKHTKSNAIVLAKNGQLYGSGAGQTSRVDALRHAIEKAASFGFSLKGAVMASDAFFPFSDCVQIAHEAGISAIVQPGGSVRDKDSIDEADRCGIAMVTTGVRHFKH